MSKNFLLAALAFCTLGLVASPAEAQIGAYQQRYDSPYGPTLSPYLDYFRRDTGLLNRHHAFVRPSIETQRSIRQLERNTLDQRSQLGNLRSQVRILRESTVAPTGTAGRFMDYSHYYQFSPASPQR